jgi:hypothetical protein
VAHQTALISREAKRPEEQKWGQPGIEAAKQQIAAATDGGLAVVVDGVGDDASAVEQRYYDEKDSLSVAEMGAYCAAPEVPLMANAVLIKQEIVVDGRMTVPVEKAIVV